MNEIPDNDLPAELLSWLHTLDQRTPSAPARRHTNTDRFLRDAIRCYINAGWEGDLFRLYDHLGDYQQAGAHHESKGRYAEAASCFEQAQLFERAAHCYLRLGESERGAECLIRAGKQLEAAWVLAHDCKGYVQARILLDRVTPRTDEDRLSRDLVEVSITAGNHDARRAALMLQEIIAQLAEAPSYGMQHQRERARLLAEEMNRPDLVALCLAGDFRAGVPKAGETWEHWAVRCLGDASGVPEEPEAVSIDHEISGEGESEITGEGES